VISQKTSHGDKRKYLFCKTVSIPFIEKYVQQVSPFIIFYGIFDFTTIPQFLENMGFNSDFNGWVFNSIRTSIRGSGISLFYNRSLLRSDVPKDGILGIIFGTSESIPATSALAFLKKLKTSFCK